MERLNDIMMRTAQRRQHIHNADQQTAPQDQEATPQGQPPYSPRSPLTRRAPLPEQTARQGQYPTHSAYPAPTQSSRSGQPVPRQPQSQSSQPYNRQTTSGTTQRGVPPTHYAQPHASSQGYDQGRQAQGAQGEQRRIVNERRSMHYPPSTPLPQEPSAPQNMGQPQRKPRISGDYYDTYEAVPPGDVQVQEEWDEDEAAMRYGDWEGEENAENSEPSRYNRASAESFEQQYTPPQGTAWPAGTRAYSRPPVSPLATRQLTSLPNQELEQPEYRSPLTRRDPRLSQIQAQHPSASRVAPPTPQALPQETPRYQRHTQPLNPNAIAGMSRNTPQERQQSLPPTAQQRPPVQRPQSAQLLQQEQPLQPAPLPLQATCPLCKGAGYLRADVPYGHPNFGKPIACECKEAERAEKRRMHLRSISNLDAFRDKNFKNFNPHVPGIQAAFNVAQAYANDPDGWLLLVGRNGCGKTHLAAAIANQHLAKGSLVLFATVPDLLDHLRATFAPSSSVVYDQLFSSMREAELLILDDLGAEQNSPWASEKLFQLLNYRYNSRFPTVITTNKIRLQAVDERVRSRLTDTSLVTEIVMDRVQDYRPHNPRRE